MVFLVALFDLNKTSAELSELLIDHGAISSRRGRFHLFHRDAA